MNWSTIEWILCTISELASQSYQWILQVESHTIDLLSIQKEKYEKVIENMLVIAGPSSCGDGSSEVSSATDQLVMSCPENPNPG